MNTQVVRITVELVDEQTGAIAILGTKVLCPESNQSTVILDPIAVSQLGGETRFLVWLSMQAGFITRKTLVAAVEAMSQYHARADYAG